MSHFGINYASAMTDKYAVANVISVVIVPIVYGIAFWRVGRRNAGNKIMESACIAGGIFTG